MSARTGRTGRSSRARRIGALIGAAVFAVALGGCSSGSGTTAPATTTAPQTSSASVAPTTSTPPATSAVPSSAAPSSTTSGQTGTGPVLRAGYLPLWPFGSPAQVVAWQKAYRAGGSQPWHASDRATALAFVRSYLGYTEIDRVTGRAGTATDARVGVGWADPNGRDVTVGVVHLLRFGTAADAPWEVVGTKDSRLSLTAPRYGSTVTSPLTVGGRITGVDESLVVQVRSLSSDGVLATSAPLPAGGEDTAWSTRLRVDAPSGTVLTVSVSTGGHLMGVESFAVTGVRVR